MKRLLLTLLTFCCFLPSRATDFLVTSNLETGPGTLSEALQLAAANGTDTRDYIRFGFTDLSEAGRTIILTQTLPAVSGNLEIDGTSQTGFPFGKNDARVMLVKDEEQFDFVFMSIEEVSDVAVYGICFYDRFFRWGWYSGAWKNIAILIFNVNRISIGAPGRGNFFKAMNTAIATRQETTNLNPVSRGLTIRANMFNYSDAGSAEFDGSNAMLTGMGQALLLNNVADLQIGGPLAEDGNCIKTSEIHINNLYYHNDIDLGTLEFRHNNINIAMLTLTPVSSASTPHTTVDIGYANDIGVTQRVNISDNRAAKVVFNLAGLKKPFVVQRNSIWKYKRSNDVSVQWLRAHDCASGGTIGGENETDANRVKGNFKIEPYDTETDWTPSVTEYNSPGVTFLKNVLDCACYTQSGFRGGDFGWQEYSNASYHPYIRTTSLRDGFVQGVASPGSVIDVYQDDDCMACEGIAYLGRTTAATDSTWQFSGPFTGTVVATATNAGHSTSAFTQPWLLYTNWNNIKIPACGQNNGSITGIQPKGSFDNFEWHRVTFDQNTSSTEDRIISTEIDLHDIGPGWYYFVAKLGSTCSSVKQFFDIRNEMVTMDFSKITISPANCGDASGGISGINLNNHVATVFEGTMYAVSEQRIEFPSIFNGATRSYDIENLPPGKYKLIMLSSSRRCGDSTTWINVPNAAGPSLDMSAMQINPSTCGNNSGSITGIMATNALGEEVFIWESEEGQRWPASRELQQVPAGRYRLLYKDRSACDTLRSVWLTIELSGTISLQEDGGFVEASDCNDATGAINGLICTGGENYTWTNIETQQVVGRQLNLQQVPAGSYQLAVTNALGCSFTSKRYSVPQAGFTPLAVNVIKTTDAHCDQQNGSIGQVQLDGNTVDYAFQWTGPSGNIAGSPTGGITGLAPGVYQLTATDPNGCSGVLTTVIIRALTPPSFVYSSMNITSDNCEKSNGSIRSVRLINAHPLVQYRWTNSFNETVGTEEDLLNVPAGAYSLEITDALGCSQRSTEFNIAATNNALPAPLYADQVIARHSSTVLTTRQNPTGFIFELHLSATGNDLLETNENGRFTTPVLANDQVYFVRVRDGSCYSPFTAVRVTVADETRIFVPNSFSPNGDGQNDNWQPIVRGVIGNFSVQVYDRFGTRIFYSTNPANGWNGFVNGKPAVAGAYVYFYKGTGLNEKQLSGKGTVILLR